jgi:hypothetical protein
MLDLRERHSDGTRIETFQAGFESLNDDLVLRTAALLNRIVGDESSHPKLLNTLALLEHMGSHKIMATQHGAAIDQPTLRHVAEECHHAFFMKRQAEKAAGRTLGFEPDELLAPRAARMYFQRLEASLVRGLAADGDPGAAYLYMSMIVEFRAVWFYSLYQQALRRHSHPLSLKRLLGEEQNHLTDMADRLEHAGWLSDARVDAFVRAEHALYGRLLDSLHESVN